MLSRRHLAFREPQQLQSATVPTTNNTTQLTYRPKRSYSRHVILWLCSECGTITLAVIEPARVPFPKVQTPSDGNRKVLNPVALGGSCGLSFLEPLWKRHAFNGCLGHQMRLKLTSVSRNNPGQLHTAIYQRQVCLHNSQEMEYILP